MEVLVVNCGSSSIKFQLDQMPQGRTLAKGLVERIGEDNASLHLEHNGQQSRRHCAVANHHQGMDLVLDSLASPDSPLLSDIRQIGAVGHRVVHGGEKFTGSVLIDQEVEDSIERYADLAPLHNPPNLTGIRAARRRLPDTPQVACFDTAFHTTIPRMAYLYALPYELYERYGIRRYGFHGTSHRWVARRAAARLGRDKYDIHCITCHLGNGCSMTAVNNGRSIDTSMGLTPLEGLVMGTRSGDFDPAILFYLTEKGYSIDQLNSLCNKQSGLLGISGCSNDMRTITQKADQGDERARLAIDIFCYRIRKYLGAYAVVLGRLDAVVLTGGIGENAPRLRAQILQDLEILGVVLDPALNEATVQREGEISAAGSRVKALVIPTNEEGAIAADTYEIANQLKNHRAGT